MGGLNSSSVGIKRNWFGEVKDSVGYLTCLFFYLNVSRAHRIFHFEQI